MEIKVVKLVSGDEVICDVEETPSGYKLKNAHQVQVVPSRSGQPAFGLLPYPITSEDKEIEVKHSSVMFICNPGEEFIAQYKSILGIGIVVPQKEIIF